MLSERSAAVVSATAANVGDAIERITAVFYGRMFAEHPEYGRDLFNRGNQANGSQSRALAGSIVTFARMLLARPDQRPDELLARVAHKHASLGITAEQYPVVRRHLFAAMAEVLGDAVTPEVVDAWDEVYWLLAGALIAMEARLYAGAGVKDGQVWRTWEVTGRRPETADVASFSLRPVDGGAVPLFQPGQYISLRVVLPDGARQIRQYSLISPPGHERLAVAVKRVAGPPAGEVSTWLHEHLRVGDTLEASAPFGAVVLDEEDSSPLVLASAGIGCTPMIGIMAHLARRGSRRTVTALHADRSPASHAFRRDLLRLADTLPGARAHIWYEHPQHAWPAERTGWMDLSGVPVPGDSRAYLCGPVPFMRSVRGQLLARGVRPERIHYEVFGPDQGLDAQ